MCYKEAGAEEFEQFCEEVEQKADAGEDTTLKQDVKDILRQIDEADSKKNEDKPKVGHKPV